MQIPEQVTAAMVTLEVTSGWALKPYLATFHFYRTQGGADIIKYIVGTTDLITITKVQPYMENQLFAWLDQGAEK